MSRSAVSEDRRPDEVKGIFRFVVVFSERLCALSGAIAGIGIFILVFLVMNDVLMRYVFNSPTTWGLEISSYLLLYITSLSLSYVMSLERHVKIDILVIHLPERIQNILSIFAFTICLAFGLAMSWITSETALLAYREWWRSNSQLMFPLFPVHVIMPIGFVLFSLECICKFFIYSNRLVEHKGKT